MSYILYFQDLCLKNMALPSFGSFFNAKVDSLQNSSKDKNLKFGVTSHFINKENIQGNNSKKIELFVTNILKPHRLIFNCITLSS